MECHSLKDSAVSGVAQSRTRLKRLSSSSSRVRVGRALTTRPKAGLDPIRREGRALQAGGGKGLLDMNSLGAEKSSGL